jgi:hypothetical protein
MLARLLFNTKYRRLDPKIPEWVFLGPGDIIGKMAGLSEEGQQLCVQNVKNRLLHAPAA